MHMGFPIRPVVHLSHHIAPFGNNLPAAGAAPGMECSGQVRHGMSLPAVTAPVYAHQVEILSGKENRMHFCSPGEVFSAERAVRTPGFRIRGILGLPAGISPRPAFPAPEKKGQNRENKNENNGRKGFRTQRQEAQIPKNSILWFEI
jgi:hypothetical protein